MNELRFLDPPMIEQVLKARRHNILEAASRVQQQRRTGSHRIELVQRALADLGTWLIVTGERLQARNPPVAPSTDASSPC